MTISKWQKIVHQNAKNKGFYDGPLGQRTDLRIASMLALVHSEVSEALEDVRKGHMKTEIESDGKPVGFPSELADIVIRVLDMAEWMGIDMNAVMKLKHDYNCTREYRNGNKRL